MPQRVIERRPVWFKITSANHHALSAEGWPNNRMAEVSSDSLTVVATRRSECISSLACLAYLALVLEASTFPKPGLVCPNHQGSHRDMDYPMFLESACSLRPYFEKCALIGQKFCQEPPKTVFLRLREAGIKAETNMLKVTNGVNTHKGAIFSLGLIVGAAGRLRGLHKLLSATSIGLVAASLVEGIVRDELTTLRDKIPNKSLSIGEKLFLKYGVGGIRREAEAGFPTAVMACQCLKNLLNYGVPLEIALPQVLLIIIKQSFDTNLLWRGGLKGVHYAKQSVADALNKGGWLAPAGQVIVGHMVGEFARQNLSPGGSADLLAVAIFFLLVDQSPNGLLDLPMLISQVRSRTIEFDPLIERSYLG